VSLLFFSVGLCDSGIVSLGFFTLGTKRRERSVPGFPQRGAEGKGHYVPEAF